MTHIQVYVARGCPVCVHTCQLALAIKQRYPHIDLDLIDVDDVNAADLPDAVFATPTWLWHGKLFSLGNPDEASLWRRLAETVPFTSTMPFEEINDGREDATVIDDGVVSGSV